MQVGCYAITTDSRALWKANNPNDVRDARARRLDRRRARRLPGAPPWPELAADLTLAGTPTAVDECAQMRLYRDEVVDFWREQPGEKGLLALQATRMLWSPVAAASRTRAGSGTARLAPQDDRARVRDRRSTRSRSSASSSRRGTSSRSPLLLLAYNTLAAMVFAGTARYRAPWDFLLALLAAFALAAAMGACSRRGVAATPARAARSVELLDRARRSARA